MRRNLREAGFAPSSGKSTRRALAFGSLCVLTSVTGCGEEAHPRIGPLSQPRTMQAIVAGTTDIAPHFEATGALLIATQIGQEPVRTRLCTATLIAPDSIVTAAHCRPEQAIAGVWQDDAPFFAQAREFATTAPTMRGSTRARPVKRVWYSFCLTNSVSAARGMAQGADAACTHATDFVVHPNYRLPGPWDTGLMDAYDVGLLKLEHALGAPAPAQLLAHGQRAALQAGAVVSIAGFGSTIDHAALGRFAQASGVKRVAQSRIGQLSDIEMTIGEPPCPAHKSFGDSGGPTFIQTPDGQRLAGVTSRLLADVDAAMGTIDTRLDAVAEWIWHICDPADEADAADDEDVGDAHDARD